MADWVTISSLATAGGTMVLALATFSSVRSANRSARIAEQSLLVGLRPVLVPSRPEDPPERVTFVECGFVVNGGTADMERAAGSYFLAIPLRNAVAVLAGGAEQRAVGACPLQEEVEVVLPREADAAVHLQRGRGHPPARVSRVGLRHRRGQGQRLRLVVGRPRGVERAGACALGLEQHLRAAVRHR